MSKSITFKFEKSTKNAHRYTEESGDSQVAVGTLYLKKSYLQSRSGSEQPPNTVLVSIELDSGNENN